MSEPPPLPNQARRAEDGKTTLGGKAKLKFVPTFSAKKKAEPEAKQEVKPEKSRADAGRGRGRGRGRGGAPGGSDRPPLPPRPEDQMVASGPFAMGPAPQTRRAGPRAAPALGLAPEPAASGSGLAGGLVPQFPLGRRAMKMDLKDEDEDDDVYSDLEDGVQIIDLADVRRMDYNAPETVRKESKKRPKVKVDPDDIEFLGMNIAPAASADDIVADFDDADELSDLIRAVTGKQDELEIESLAQELFVFQFPRPFPTFKSTAVVGEDAMDVDSTPQSTALPSALKSEKAKGKEKATDPSSTVASSSRHVAFADEVKPLDEFDEEKKETSKKIPLDGLVGALEVYSDGTMKMRFGDNIVMNLTSATPASYLQNAVHVNREGKKMIVLGEVRQRFVATPDLDELLLDLDANDATEAAAKAALRVPGAAPARSANGR